MNSVFGLDKVRLDDRPKCVYILIDYVRYVPGKMFLITTAV